MALMRYFRYLIVDLLSDIKHALSPEVIACIKRHGKVGRFARVYTQFDGSISIGQNVNIGRYSVISNYEKDGKISIGDGTSIGWSNNFYGQGGIAIGKNVLFASYVCILTSNHGWDDHGMPIKNQQSTYEGVSIGDDSWIGYNVVILSGVRIGKHAVVGAGSVVTKDLPDYSVCAGNPCRVIRYIDGQ